MPAPGGRHKVLELKAAFPQQPGELRAAAAERVEHDNGRLVRDARKLLALVIPGGADFVREVGREHGSFRKRDFMFPNEFVVAPLAQIESADSEIARRLTAVFVRGADGVRGRRLGIKPRAEPAVAERGGNVLHDSAGRSLRRNQCAVVVPEVLGCREEAGS